MIIVCIAIDYSPLYWPGCCLHEKQHVNNTAYKQINMLLHDLSVNVQSFISVSYLAVKSGVLEQHLLGRWWDCASLAPLGC